MTCRIWRIDRFDILVSRILDLSTLHRVDTVFREAFISCHELCYDLCGDMLPNVELLI